ncbi:MAG: hypothetical protein ACXV74_10590 [Methylobacter sp.]
MTRQIITSVLDGKRLKDELEFMIQYFHEKGVDYCSVLFGFAWGNEYYRENDWSEEKIALAHLAEKVREVDAKGLGALGRDDLFVKVAGLEFQFCHESDLHIHFIEVRNDDVEFFYARWQDLGYEPSEWVKNKGNGSGERVRPN